MKKYVFSLPASLTIALLVFPAVHRAAAQDTIPSQTYFAGFEDFYDGDYGEALDFFNSALRGATKVGTVRWVDSICYYTMIGECHYRMGQYPEALDSYAAALQLHMAYPDWLGRLTFTSDIRPRPRTGTPWGESTRSKLLGAYPKNAGYQVDKLGLVNQGGEKKFMQQYEMRLIQADEIVRCIALAMRRRHEILGTLCKYDPLTGDVLASAEQSPGLPNHWSQAWCQSLQGLALLAAGKPAEATPILKRATAARGQFDHVLTPTILLELGRLSLEQGDYDAAIPLLYEASVSAFHNFDGGVLEDALTLAAIAHLAADKKGNYPPLPAAIAWARAKGYRTMAVSLTLLSAESQIVMGKTATAGGLLTEAHALMGRLPMRAGAYGARLDYLRAMAAYRARKIAEGDKALSAALGGLLRSSLWLFQIRTLEARYQAGDITTSGPITMRAAAELYQTLLRDPGPIDWDIRPEDSLAVLKTPHGAAFEHWFLIALDRNEHEKAFEIADRARRHRFYNTMGFGGRMLSLRKLLEAPESDLESDELLKRRDLLARFPAYAELSRKASAIRAKLETMPLVPSDEETAREMASGLAAWDAASTDQEALLREIAVRREDVPLVFPPLASMQAISETLPPDQALLLFFTVGQDTYAYLVGEHDYDLWRVRSTSLIYRLTTELLRALGQFDANRELTLDDLKNDAWKAKSAELLAAITDGSRADFAADFPQLAIVPDGVLWYVPFEALHVEIDGQLRPLVSRFAVRYAPTASLAVPGRRRGRALTIDTLVEIGKLYPKDEPEVAATAFQKMNETLPRMIGLRGPTMPGATSVYASLVKQLVVLGEIHPPGRGPYSWSPMTIEAGKPGNQLLDWLTLPWGGPRLIVLPGFHTTAEDGLRRVNRSHPGREVFLNVCALMAGGADTVLLTRWRPGGQSSYDLVREFLRFYPDNDAADAWRKAVYVVAAQKVQVDKEPRIRAGRGEDPPIANHPFFWAPFLLVDRGQSTAVEPEDLEEDEPNAEQAGEDQAGDEAASDDAAAGDDAAGDDAAEDAVELDPIDGTVVLPDETSNDAAENAPAEDDAAEGETTEEAPEGAPHSGAESVDGASPDPGSGPADADTSDTADGQAIDEPAEVAP